MSCACAIQSSSSSSSSSFEVCAASPGLGTTSCGSRQPCAFMNLTTDGCVGWAAPPPQSGARAAGSANRDGAWTSHDPLSRSGAADLASSRRDAALDDTPEYSSETSRRTFFRAGDSTTTASTFGRDPPARARSSAPIASPPHARELATSAVTSAPRNIPNPVARATNVERPGWPNRVDINAVHARSVM